MAKEVTAKIKIQAPGGKATPAPPIGPALGQHGVNIGQFIQQFNARTGGDLQGVTVPAVITVYADRTFDFVVKSPPASVLLRMAANVEKGSGEPNKNKVGQVSRQQVREIAQRKMADMNSFSPEAAEKVVMGTARSMGIDIVD
jgi:large subunit ribosomal protein L11